MKRCACSIVAMIVALAGATAFSEPQFAFKNRLITVHRTDRRDLSLRAKAGEFEFADGTEIVIPDGASVLTRNAAEDFADYLIVSMGVNASVRKESAPTKPGLCTGVEIRVVAQNKRGYEVDVGADCVRIAASDDRMSAQALYHLEDLMNLRRGPFLVQKKEVRHPLFEHRITFSGFGNDIFPDGHLNQIAHYGFTDIEVWLRDYDVISQGVRQDVNDLIARAAKFGLSVHFEPRNRAFVHPDDPKADEAYRAAYGKLTEYYPNAGSAMFCGEVCEFPSKDPRANGRSYLDNSPKKPGDTRPNPGWYPCRDWADWAKKVMPMTREGNKDFRFGFSTYNWGGQDEQARAELIAALPKDITLLPTFEMFDNDLKRNGLVSPVADYSISYPGPGKYFTTEASQAKAAGIELWSNCNSAGLTWDFGNIPYQPVPWQWKKRWDGLKDAHYRWNLSGLRENHEYGWYPSFIAELEKEYMCEGGMDFEQHIRAIAERDYGAENVEAAIGAWNRWSHAAADYVASDENQYGQCRVGPAYPFNFYGKNLQDGWNPPKDFPLDRGAEFAICFFDLSTRKIDGLGAPATAITEADELKEIELFESQVEDYRAGAEAFGRIALAMPESRCIEAVRMAVLGEYLMRACLTSVHLKKGRMAFRKGDRSTVLALAKAEYDNARFALRLVDEDSRLGWLASSGYTGGRRQIEWKLRKMRELYGSEVCGDRK